MIKKLLNIQNFNTFAKNIWGSTQLYFSRYIAQKQLIFQEKRTILHSPFHLKTNNNWQLQFMTSKQQFQNHLMITNIF